MGAALEQNFVPFSGRAVSRSALEVLDPQEPNWQADVNLREPTHPKYSALWAYWSDPMCNLAYYLAAGIAVGLAMDFAPLPGGSAFHLFTNSTMRTDAGMQIVVNRQGKGDRLAAVRQGHNPVITSVEVVGLRDAAVVYRDRDGRVLYQTDPLTNATVVARDVVLPEVTIRSDAQSGVRPVPVESSPPTPPQAKEPARPKIPVGCDPAFSPLSSAAKSNFSARCLADRGASISFATAMAIPVSEYPFH